MRNINFRASSARFLLLASLTAVLSYTAFGKVSAGVRLNAHAVSITQGAFLSLQLLSGSGVQWKAADTSIASVSGGIVTANAVGVTTVRVSSIVDASDFDTCQISVVPWLAQSSYLRVRPLFKNMKALGLINDTLYLFSQGGPYGWASIYYYVRGMIAPQLLHTFPYDKSYSPDEEFMHATPFGLFVLAKRETQTSPRKIYKAGSLLKDLSVVYDDYPPSLYDGVPPLSYVMNQGWSHDDFGNIYLGEYCSDDVRYPDLQIHILRGSNWGTKWDVVHTFPGRLTRGLDGGVRHCHACQVDPFTGDVWISTGDANDQSRIYVHRSTSPNDTSSELSMSLVGYGSQEYRVVSFAFTQDYIYWFMDSPDMPQQMFRVRRASDYPTLTPQTPLSADYRERLGTFRDKPLWNSLTVRDDGNRSVILVEAAYENAMHYGTGFKELDQQVRVYGIREGENGSVQVQEVLALPALVANGHMKPIGQDSYGNIYLNGANVEYPFPVVYEGLLDWNDVDSVYVSGGKSLAEFSLSGLVLEGDFDKPGFLTAFCQEPINNPQTPPGVDLTQYAWKAIFRGNEIRNGRLSIALDRLASLQDPTRDIWLVRRNSLSPWKSVGGVVNAGKLYSTVSFDTISGIAVGTFQKSVTTKTGSISFGELEVSHSLSKTIKIYNQLRSNVSLDSVTTYSSAFILSPLVSWTQLRGGDSLTINISFAPQAAGIFEDTLRIYYQGWALESVPLNGQGSYVNSVRLIDNGGPHEFNIDQNYPNPFNPSTTIRFGLPSGARVTIEAYDILGRRVSRVIDGDYLSGFYAVQWVANGFASGFYVLDARISPWNGAPMYRKLIKSVIVR